MKNETLTFLNTIARDNPKAPFNLSYLLALTGIGGGMLSIFMGFIFIIIHALLKGDVIFNQIGTVLMISGIPMMLVGGHFMDKATEKKK